MLKLAQFYSNDFSARELDHLSCQLLLFIADARGNERFREVRSVVEVSVMLVPTKKHIKHDIVHMLLKLVLLLPVPTASVEHVFPIMNYVKNKLINRKGDQYLKGCLVA